MGFTSMEREQILNKMAKETYDVLVIGGGITGAGIVFDAATRGMKAALVEMQDFAAGTSSRSTKLVHGGLRYLKQFEVKMVAEVGRERAVVYENGPHVTTPEWMLLPIHKGGTFGKFSTSIGLLLYDYLAAVKKSERRKMLNAEETLRKEPLLKREGLKGGGYYVEYRTDDARLTIEVMKEAVKFGADVVNYAKVTDFIYQDNKVVGVRVEDVMSKKTYEIFTKKIINATGPWVDKLREKDRSKKGKKLRLTKGVHVVFDQSKFPLKQAIYFDTPDGRMVFAIPRDGKTYVGTTDTFYTGDTSHPKMTYKDREYLLKAIRFMFPDLTLSESDVESSWAGVRPLIYEEGKNPSEISRKDEIWTSESGLITIAGGKLTGYRKMAETVVDLVVRQLNEEGINHFDSCKTKRLPISGGHVGGSKNFPNFIKQKINEGLKAGLTKEEAEQLAKRYGSNVDHLFRLVKNLGTEAETRKIPAMILAQVEYAITEEMAVTPVDFFVRRTGALMFDIDWVRTWKDPIIDYMSGRLKWDDNKKEQMKEQLEASLHDAVVPVDESFDHKQE